MATSVAAALTGIAVDASALTLGRANVLSSLGQALRAEIEFETLNAAEAESLRASLATADGYRAAGAQFNPALAGARVVLQRIANRRASLLITSDRLIQDPFVEVVLDLNWSGGRLVRNYTLLLDPPGSRTPPRPASLTPLANPSGLAGQGQAAGMPPLTTGTASPAAPLPQMEAPRPRARERSSAGESLSRRGPPPVGAPPAPAQIDDPYRVRTGDTLSEVAQRGVRPAGISLDRLVLAMYRDNPDAFVDGNIHKLRKGVVLAQANASTIDSVSDAEARRVIKAQSTDFEAYRRQLAQSPTERPTASSRSASGKLDADVQVRDQASSRAPDVLTLSKPGAPSASASDAAMTDALKREREKAQAKVAELSKNVQDLERLSANAASQPASAGSAAPAGGGQAESGVGPAVAVGGTPAASAPEAAPSVAPPPPVVASAAAPAPLPPVRPTAPSNAEPGLMDSLLDDNLPAVGLGAALLALLAGFGIFRLVKRRREAAPETSFLESRLQPDSFFGASGGERVDTSVVPATGNNSSMMNYSLSQLDAIGDVDPVAEADVYMAYGRDLQAEEILKEAMRTSPERLPIRTKLLEVYAKRRDTKGFEALALELFSITHGRGDDWARARQLGLQIDPENPLYNDGAPSTPMLDAGPTEPPVGGLDVATMPLSILPGDPPANSSFDLDLDLDLGVDEATQLAPPSTARTTGAADQPVDDRFKPDPADMLNFSNSGFIPRLPEIPASPPAHPLTPITAPAPAQPPTVAAKPPADPFSMSEFALDLDLPEPSGLSAGPSMLPPIGEVDLPLDDLGGPSDFDPDSGLEGDPLARKLELADEFRQIGDIDGARDLLQEVIASADGALKSKAQAMLDNLS
ncbi:MAG: FimV/HubP family polar landmark protein [Ideonella sp.]